MRANSYKLSKMIIKSSTDWKVASQFGLDYSLTKSLTRDQRFEGEVILILMGF